MKASAPDQRLSNPPGDPAGERLGYLPESAGASRARAESGLRQLQHELERARAELEQLSYAAAHDLREPAQLIASCAQLLARHRGGQAGLETSDVLAALEESVNLMQERIQGLVDCSRVTTRGKPFRPTRCEDVFDLALRRLGPIIAQSGAAISHDPLPVVMADAEQLQRLFEHLLSNAIKFRGQDPPRIHVGAADRPAEWELCFSDNGIGIDPQFAERIFVIFQRLHTRTERPGTGVGLAVSRRIVERHGGRLWVESEPLKGATFRFTLSKQAGAADRGTEDA